MGQLLYVRISYSHIGTTLLFRPKLPIGVKAQCHAIGLLRAIEERRESPVGLGRDYVVT